MNWSVLIIVGTQILFSTSDLLARIYMPKHGFVLASFISGWFLAYFFLRTLAMFGQLYVFTSLELGKTMALFGAVSILIANILGVLVLQEVLSPSAYIGVSLAILAFIILAFI
jgi:uncharacterized membrane protein